MYVEGTEPVQIGSNFLNDYCSFLENYQNKEEVKEHAWQPGWVQLDFIKSLNWEIFWRKFCLILAGETKQGEEQWNPFVILHSSPTGKGLS